MAALLTTLGLAACSQTSSEGATSTTSSSSPSTTSTPGPVAEAVDCADLASRSVDALQRHVDRFADVDPAELQTAVVDSQADLAATTAAAQRRARELGCELEPLRDLFARELDRLQGDGPVSDAVARTFRSALLGGDDPSDPGPTEITVDTADALVAAVGTAGSGSTITVAPGEYRLEEPLVAFRPIALRGVPDEPASIVSTARGVTILSLADGTVALGDLVITHEGDEPASIVSFQAGTARLERVRVSGARVSETTGGFGLLLRSPTSDGSTVLDSTFRDNEGGGIVVAGTNAPVLRGLTLRANGLCGVCYTEDAAGLLEQSDVADLSVGVRIEGNAAPRLRELTFSRLDGAAIVVTGQSAADVDAVTCDDSDGAVVIVAEEATPTFGEAVSCAVAEATG